MDENGHEVIVSSVPVDLLFQKVIIERCVQSISPNTSVTPDNVTSFHAYSIPEVTVSQYLERYIFILN
jgi:hypothetical protein